MDKFYIDRQFGQPIFIDVENGIVQNCYNETENFNNKMNEHYKEKSISFLKTDFEKRMKPAYYNVRPLCLSSAYNKIDAVKSWINNIDSLIRCANDDNKNELTIKIALDWWNSLTLETIDLQEKYYPYIKSPQNLNDYQILAIYAQEINKIKFDNL